MKFHLLYDRVLVVAFRLPSVESSYLCLVRFCKLGSARGVVGVVVESHSTQVSIVFEVVDVSACIVLENVVGYYDTFIGFIMFV